VIEKIVLKGPRVTLREFGPGDVSSRYLSWLNNPIVNALSRRAETTTSADQARAYLGALDVDECVLAIEVSDHGHVGNIKYGPIDRKNKRADLSIIIGEPTIWGQGVGREATYLTARYLFEIERLNRIDAGSANPAFLRMVEGLGWKVEGILRERVNISGRFLDWTVVAQLRHEFRFIDRYEPLKSIVT